MARRSAPPNSGPAYIGRIPAAGGPADDGNALTNFIRDEVSLYSSLSYGPVAEQEHVLWTWSTKRRSAVTLHTHCAGAPINATGPQLPLDCCSTSICADYPSQITSPEKLAGNLSILTGVTVFLAGIFAVRTWGENMVPV
ncbi:hypothetical protein HDZ31DRAFT_32430 [Schizophyllum fasciatum]